MSPVRILAIAGSLRQASFNRKLLALAVEVARRHQAEVEVYDLKVANLPIYDGDLEAEGFPEEAMRLKRRLAQAEGLLIATPEYNHGLPGGLKNAIDWASRPLPAADGQGHPLSNPFRGKLAAHLGGTPGMGGTLYAQLALRETLNTLGTWLVPGAFTVSRVGHELDERGQLKDAAKRERLERYVSEFVGELARRTRPAELG